MFWIFHPYYYRYISILIGSLNIILSIQMSVAETLIGSDDRKSSLVETMQLISIMDALSGNTNNIPDLCARKRTNKIGYMG